MKILIFFPFPFSLSFFLHRNQQPWILIHLPSYYYPFHCYRYYEYYHHYNYHYLYNYLYYPLFFYSKFFHFFLLLKSLHHFPYHSKYCWKVRGSFLDSIHPFPSPSSLFSPPHYRDQLYDNYDDARHPP